MIFFVKGSIQLMYILIWNDISIGYQLMLLIKIYVSVKTIAQLQSNNKNSTKVLPHISKKEHNIHPMLPNLINTGVSIIMYFLYS